MSQTNLSVDLPGQAVIWNYHLDGQGGGQQQERYPKIHEDEPGFDWLHLRSDEPGSIEYMQRMGLDPKLIEVLSAIETRPRMQILEEGVLINLRGVNTNPGADPEDMVSLRIWFNDDIVITARKRERRLLSVEDVRQGIENGRGPKSPAEFVTMIIERLASRISDVVDSIDNDLTVIETELDEKVDNVQKIQQRLSDLRKQTAVIRRYLAPQREALSDLYRSTSFLSTDDCQSIRHQTDRITLYVEDLDLSRERALVLHAELQNRIAEQQNSRMYLLSIVATIFLPLSFLTGVFGMNVAGLPGLENPNAFTSLTLGMFVVAALIIGYIWWKKWF